MVEWEVFDEHFRSVLYLTRNLDGDSFIFLIVGSYGDVFVNFAFLETTAKHHQRKIIALVDKKWAPIALRFKSDNVTPLFLENEQQIKNSLMSLGHQYRFKPGFVYPLLATMHPLLDRFWFNFYATDFEIKKIILHIPKETKNIISKIDEQRLYEINKLFEATGARKGSSCIFSFQSNSNPSLPISVIVKLVKIFSQNNIDVLINSAHTFDKEWAPPELAQIPSIKVPADCPVEFIETAGFHIGSIHGLTQILANYRTNAKMALVADLSNKFTINNGSRVEAEKVLLLKNASPTDICPENDYSEFSFNENTLEHFYDQVEKWVRSRR
jgi:hypothetical protein